MPALTKCVRTLVWLVIFCLIGFTAACTSPVNTLPPPTNATSTALPADTAQPSATALPTVVASFIPPCDLPTVIAPPQPAVTPALNQIDPDTGLHVTGSLRNIDLSKYRLRVTGKVTRELSLTYDELRCLPKVTSEETLICPATFTDVAEWGGVLLQDVLALAGIKPGASVIRLVSDDGYATQLDLQEALDAGAYLAYELQGKTLPQLHGFPLRAVLPGVDGYKWIKWLAVIEVR